MNDEDKLKLEMFLELETIRELLIKNNIITGKDYVNTLKEKLISSDLPESTKEEMLKLFKEEPK